MGPEEDSFRCAGREGGLSGGGVSGRVLEKLWSKRMKVRGRVLGRNRGRGVGAGLAEPGEERVLCSQGGRHLFCLCPDVHCVAEVNTFHFGGVCSVHGRPCWVLCSVAAPLILQQSGYLEQVN